MAEIAAAAEQQVDGVRQITTALDLMNGVTQQTAANAEESAAAATELARQAGTLRHAVGTFRLAPQSAAKAESVADALVAGNSRLRRRARVGSDSGV